MRTPVLEVIACSVEDAIAAQKGGAHRLEVVSNLECGGFTPSLDLVCEIKSVVDLPLRVMVRESVGYDVKTATEFNALCAAARDLERLGVDGLVVGFLIHGKVDVQVTSEILACAPAVRATFHHAFEDSQDKLISLSAIRQLAQVDRILSHGGPGDIHSRIERLQEYQQAVTPRLQIIAGGGIDSNNVSLIKRGTSIREFHVGRAARDGLVVNGKVSAELVAGLVELISC